MPIIALTPHFTLDEMIASQTAARMGIDNNPSPAVLDELTKTCKMLEAIRAVLGHPMIITSGYRSPELNAAVGGVATSQHEIGQAADFICPGFGTPEEICLMLAPRMPKLGIDQLIWEYKSWVHVSQCENPRRMALTIDNDGTRNGFA